MTANKVLLKFYGCIKMLTSSSEWILHAISAVDNKADGCKILSKVQYDSNQLLQQSSFCSQLVTLYWIPSLLQTTPDTL
jgi:hypothetical protein